MAHRSSSVARSGLWTSFRNLLQSWWFADRIRTSPISGRVLALHTGDRFLLLNQIWIVTSRDVRCRESLASVRLRIRCESEPRSAELICETTDVVSSRNESVGLRINGRMVPVWDEDFSLLPSSSSEETAGA